MKKYLAIISSIIISIIIVTFIWYNFNINNTNNDEILHPNIGVDEIIDNIISWDILDDSGMILIHSECYLPKYNDNSEFSVNFNEYYSNVHLKIVEYTNSEGNDLANYEKSIFKDDYIPITYKETFEKSFEDDNLISITRQTTIISNETEKSKIHSETFDKTNGSLVLITDISTDFIETFESETGISIKSLENLIFSLTPDGISASYDTFQSTISYKNLTLTDNYKYLGE